MSIKPLVAGNWKMNGLRATLPEFQDMNERYNAAYSSAVDMMICPPATLIQAMASLGGPLGLGAQDCHIETKGAHTGDISAEMLVDSGANAIIVGHSERRADHGENNATVKVKACAAHRAGACAVICVGESRDEREAGCATKVVLSQLDGSMPDDGDNDNTVIAYEPVWAIGTGLVPTLDDIAEMHLAIRLQLTKTHGEKGARMRILYGGSVKPDNAATLLAVENVNGALVGGASLKADDFFAIARTYLA